MATEDQLLAESRERPRMAVVAGVAALLTFVSAIVGFLPGTAPINLPASLLFFHDHQVVIAIGAVCSVIGSIALAFTLAFLYRAARLRNVEVRAQLSALPWVGGFGAAIAFAVTQVVLSVNIAHFATHGTQTYDEARKATDYGVLAVLGPVAQLLLAAAIVIVSINAMRVGLLTRFLGYLGIISAILFVIPLVPVPIVQVYWLGAIAALLAGRAPSGMPPAWESGKAEPWPSSQEMREARVRAAQERRGGGTSGDGDDAEEPIANGASTATALRKRKKRR